MSSSIINRAQIADGGARTGDMITCVICDRTDELLSCSRCRAVFYCTKDHQRRDWKRHREFCATHPARTVGAAEVPFPDEDKNFNREIPFKRYPPVGNHKIQPIAPVSNLGKIIVSDTSWRTNVTPNLYYDAGKLTGINISPFYI